LKENIKVEKYVTKPIEKDLEMTDNGISRQDFKISVTNILRIKYIKERNGNYK
jgi:hypothetical protein